MAVIISQPELNIREKLADLDRPVCTAGARMLLAETPQEQQALIGFGRRNFTINGDMKVWQRGTSFTSTTSSAYFADRWTMGSNVSNLTVSRNTEVAVGPFPKKNTLRMAASGASGFDLYHLYEDWEALSNQTITISFWYKTNVANVVVRQWSTYSWAEIPRSDNWSYFTTTFTLGTLVSGARAANTASFGLWAANGIVSGDYFEFTNYQLEIGSVATPFEQRSYGEELALCQRYFYKWESDAGYNFAAMGYSYSTTGINAILHFPVTMRAQPSLTVAGNWRACSATCVTGSVSGGSYNTDSSCIQMTTSGISAGVPYMMGDANDATASLSWNAEL
jgi:hypothetical protein